LTEIGIIEENTGGEGGSMNDGGSMLGVRARVKGGRGGARELRVWAGADDAMVNPFEGTFKLADAMPIGLEPSMPKARTGRETLGCVLCGKEFYELRKKARKRRNGESKATRLGWWRYKDLYVSLDYL
jgi:hypothetical protein